MTDILVTSPFRPFTLPTQFKAVFNGYIYCGTVDAADPSVSQVQVYLVNESGDKVPVAQPLRTNAGGFLVYNGQPAKFVTDSNHSMLVQDSLHAQVWYASDVAEIDPAAALEEVFDRLSTEGIDLVYNGSPVIRASQHGCVAGADISIPLQAAAIEADARGWTLLMDIPNAIISSDVVLPQRFDGNDCIFTGAGAIICRARVRARLGFFKCTTLITAGLFHSHIRNIEVTGEWIIDGYNENFGFFYNFISDVNAGWITIDVSKQAVNGNTFMCIGAHKSGEWGLTITDRGATSSLGIMEYHANNWIGEDFSHTLGTRNLIAVRKQTNAMSGYHEHGSNIKGLYHVGLLCSIVDGQTGPIVGLHNHVLGMTDVNPAAWGDSLSASHVNLNVGGDWSVRDAAGKPACFSASFAATVNAIQNTPYGFTGMYGGTTTSAGQILSIKGEQTFSGYFSQVVIMYVPLGSVDLPTSIVITSPGSADSYRNGGDVENIGSGFYLYRISGKVQPGSGWTLTFFLGNGAQVYLGASFATAYKAALMPSYTLPQPGETTEVGGMVVKRGSVGQGYVSGAAFFDKTITYGQPFPSTVTTIPEIVGVKPAASWEGKMSRHEILSYSNSGFVARFYYTTDWAGDIFWRATSV